MRENSVIRGGGSFLLGPDKDIPGNKGAWVDSFSFSMKRQHTSP